MYKHLLEHFYTLFTGAKEAKFPYFSKGKPVSSWLISKILRHFSLQILGLYF